MCVTNNTYANIGLMAALSIATYGAADAAAPAAGGATGGIDIMLGATAGSGGTLGTNTAALTAAGMMGGTTATTTSWVPYALMGTQLLGTGINAYGQYAAGNAARQAGEANAALAGYSAQVNQLRAEQAKTKGELQKRDVRERLSLIRAAGRTGYAKGNVLLGVGGSPEAWERDIEYAAAVDEDMIDYNTAMDVWGFGEAAKGNLVEAQLARMEGAAGYQSGQFGMYGSLIGGGANVAERWYTYSKIGAIS